MVKIGTVQMSCSARRDDNMAKAIAGIKKAAADGAQIICLQELFTSLYFCDVEDHDNFKLAETIPGPSTDELSRDGTGTWRSSYRFSFRETHQWDLSQYDLPFWTPMEPTSGNTEKCTSPMILHFMKKFYFTPGDLGYKVFTTKFAKIGVLICWDQWYPEASRITALMGAEILFYPTAIGWATSQSEETNTEQYNAWQTIQRSHAVANGVHVVSVNRVGFEQNGAMKFWGGSFIANPFGTILISRALTTRKK